MTYSTIDGLLLLAVWLPLVANLGSRRAGDSPDGGAPDDDDPAGDVGPTARPPRGYPAGGPSTNRLADQTSLYLLMHAHNPVDWYPWGEEALAKAQSESKLIFLSIGYSSCYWCHVMERESFMDQEVAQFLNQHFVAVKVDREERPDLDEIYMTALQIYCQLIHSPQGGGWPLTMFLTPDARPVMGGTYFPPRDKNGQTGLLKVLKLVQQAWQKGPQQLRENADLMAKLVRRQLQEQPPAATPDPSLLDGVLAALVDQFDPQYGGFGYSAANPRTPKFPQPSNLVFLLDRARRERTRRDSPGPSTDGRAESMLITTLEKMAAGGIRDHLGGGFHRYSTDRRWAVPHFEKMLYDNAQLASVYAEAHGLTGREGFRHLAEEILDFVLREMTGPEGEFYAAIDAETGAEEGRCYVWRRDELTGLLDHEEFKLLADVYGIGPEGNFEGRHVLLLPRPLEETARARQWTEEQLRQRLEPIHRKLLQARDRRERPATDTKVLTAWNGLMIRGLADAGRLLDEKRYLAAAETTADFVLSRLRNPEGCLLRSLAGGGARPTFGRDPARWGVWHPHIPAHRRVGAPGAYLDDYAFLADGLIALHRATGRGRWLQEADRLTATQIDLFWDDRRGGFFFTACDHETLLARSKDPTDSALPSGNAVSVGNLVYLAGELNKPEYLDRAEQTLRAFAPLLKQTPGAMPRMAASLAAFLDVRR